ncbi:MAG TPA: NUDIX hydrolase [Gammaproteobacteria bacterium]|nr:NUDIX hydrolase [Gammaproteobacteria bacterium]
MYYCSNCGTRVVERTPQGDNRLRYVCDACDTVHYQNPKIVAGCIPCLDNRLLLCRRAIEPRYGLWTLPAGFMENGESTEQAAARETMEEACATVEKLELYGVFSIPHISQVYMMFRARLAANEFRPGSESLEVRLFQEHEIPWDNLAFPVVKTTLEHYFKDLRSNCFPVHVENIIRHPPRQR